MTTAKQARGLRNNNPGNIRQSGAKYLGEVRPSTDSAFKQFETIAWGYRAVFVLLHSYQVKHGLKTIREMISRYAPDSENNTEGYIKRVATDSGVNADMPICTNDGIVMISIIAAMSAVENATPAVMQDVRDGWDLYIKHKP